MRENLLVQWLRDNVPGFPSVAVGIGDDAAVLKPQHAQTVLTTDLICDGTHFNSEHATPRQIGRKAMAVNLSDIAAMAAEPLAAFVSLALPTGTNQAYVEELMAAAQCLANEFDCALAGGDTNTWDGRLAINVAVIGRVPERGPLLRSGANSGDVLLVTGHLGGSIEGRHFSFTPRINEALLLSEKYQLTAGMDISDGLAIDLRRLGAASGCGTTVNGSAIPISEAVKQTVVDHSEQQLRALGDGEDFELLLAASPGEAERILNDQPLGVPITAIGTCTDEQEFWLVEDDRRIPLPTAGYEHGYTR